MILGRGSNISKLSPWKSSWNQGLSRYHVSVLWESGRAVCGDGIRHVGCVSVAHMPKACLGLNSSSSHVYTCVHICINGNSFRSLWLIPLRVRVSTPSVSPESLGHSRCPAQAIVVLRAPRRTPSEAAGDGKQDDWDTAFPIDLPYHSLHKKAWFYEKSIGILKKLRS